jgi:beta-glucosidase/6-phospho-beta-glucosidase/beta-galactosidase
MKSLGVKNYRFSIAWGRIIPSGRKGGAVNQAGVDYYNSVIDEMLKSGVSPAVTLFHWDLPQANQDAYKVGPGEGQGRLGCLAAPSAHRE